MASSKALNAANLEALGATRLAELLLQISAGDAAIKRRLRLALAGEAGAAEAAREINKRLASIARAQSFLDGPKLVSLAAELEAQRRAILDLVAPRDPAEGFELIWRLMDCAPSVLSRCDDSNGRLASVFREAAHDLGPLAQAAKHDSADLAERAFQALRTDNLGQWEDLVPILAPQLGPPGLRLLKERMEAWQAEPNVVPPEHERRVVGWSSSGKIYEDELQARHRRSITTYVLKQIADAMGDVDYYISQFDTRERQLPRLAAGIARRLLQAGRPQEAWRALEAVDPARPPFDRLEWEEARLDTLEALGRSDEAQSVRWQAFLDSLNVDHLRAHLRKLPAFEDFEAEQRALAHAFSNADVHRALDFLVTWPDLERASQLVLNRAQELDGNFFELLSTAAESLGAKFPLASTVLRRAMIDFALNQGRASRYKHAARHLNECAMLARRISDFGGIRDHVAYQQSLRVAHARKSGFWQEVAALG